MQGRPNQNGHKCAGTHFTNMQTRERVHNNHTTNNAQRIENSDYARVSVCPPAPRQTDNHTLGTIAKFASHARNQKTTTRDDATIQRFKLQTYARKLLPTKRVASCLRSLVPNAPHVEIFHVPDRDSAHYHNLRTCDSVWDCPVCAAKITEQRRKELSLAVARAVVDGLTPVLVTFTMRHNRGDKLSDLLKALKTAYRAFKSGREYQGFKDNYGIAGYVTSTEVTHGYTRDVNHGWHPHLHALMFVYPIAKSALRSLENDFKARWSHVIKAQGYDATWEHGLNVKEGDRAIAEYVAKFGHEPKGAKWTVERELTKAPTKLASDEGVTPFRLLEMYGEGDTLAGELFKEYSAAFNGRAQLVWSRGTRALLGMDKELSDGEINAEEPEKAVLLTTVTVQTWYQIVNIVPDVRGELLAIASKGNADLLNEHIARLIDKHKPIVRDLQNSPTVKYLHSLGYERV